MDHKSLLDRVGVQNRLCPQMLSFGIRVPLGILRLLTGPISESRRWSRMVDVFSLIFAGTRTCARVHLLYLRASTIRLQSRISQIGLVKSLRIGRGTRIPIFSL